MLETSWAAATLALSLDPPGQPDEPWLCSVWWHCFCLTVLGPSRRTLQVHGPGSKGLQDVSSVSEKRDNESHWEKSGRKEIKVACWGAGRLLRADKPHKLSRAKGKAKAWEVKSRRRQFTFP